jgi:glycosyltransferase involved in cell wall biosynthesis
LKIWFLTRSLYPYQKGGGGQIRFGQVQFLQKLGWEIIIAMPNFNNTKIDIIDNIVQIPCIQNQKICSLLERIGIYEDYLDKWVDSAFEYLKDKISNEDIVFATSGGELGMIKLGSLLKNELNCKFVINFHDPIDYSLVHGKKLNKRFHVSREKQEKKYLKNSDLIITSSKSNQESLSDKYPEFQERLQCNYFGYIKKFDLLIDENKKSTKLKIAYVGNMGDTQRPEILYEAYKRVENKKDIEIYFIGDSKNYKPLQNIRDKNVKFVDFLPHEEFLKFMVDNIDVGFVCLANDYLGACVPSKIYEYINLGLPMIGALPKGDGMDIINNNKYGIAYKYYDVEGIAKAMNKMSNKYYLEEIKNNIISDKDKWYMGEKIKEVDVMLRRLVNAN